MNIKKQAIKIIDKRFKFLRRFNKPVNWFNLRSVVPISQEFGIDRGTPIDRVYIEDFLKKNKQYIRGVICEIAENTYSRKFGHNIKNIEILHYTNDNPHATIIGDLCDINTIPDNKIDCFILTQTLNFIYDYKLAIQGLYHMLKTDGVGLVTVAGISQISRYDMDRWGDFWRFTDLSIRKVFEEVFGKNNVEVGIYGNVLSAIAFLQGIGAEELNKKELFYLDENYQVTITVKAVKKVNNKEQLLQSES